MRVALVFPGCHRRGGVERVVWEAASHLVRSHDVYVVATEVRELPADVTWLRVRANKGLPWLAPNRFRVEAQKVVRELKPDVSVTYGAECPAGDIQVVGSVHRAWLERAGPVQFGRLTLPRPVRYVSPGNIVRRVMEKSYFGRTPQLLVPCSSRVTHDLKRIYNIRISEDQITVIHNGFDPELFSPERRLATREKVRESLGCTAEDVVLLMIANEWQRKGLKVLLDALALVRQSPFKLLLAGRMAPTPFAAQIKSLRLDDRVRYVGPVDDVASFHAAADVFVLPTQYEAFALAIVEALASGLPVITTNLPGASDLIAPDANGLLLDDPEDSQALAALLQQALNPVSRARWSENAPKSVIGFDWRSLMTTFELAMRQAIGTAKSGTN